MPLSAAILNFPTGQPAAEPVEPDIDLTRLRRQYYDYLGQKDAEIQEAKSARRYYHGSQWTAEEIAALKKRKQPVVTSNRIVRKIDAVVGLTERLRQDPKGFARTPQHEPGAELATAVLRYVLDDTEWKGKSPDCARTAAIEGIAGIEYDLAFGDQGDPDLELHIVDPDTFFYDPRSFRAGFSDARYMGTGKWIDAAQAKELVPAKEELIDSLMESGTDLAQDTDRDKVWVNVNEKKLRLVDHWYVDRAKWLWCLYVANTPLMQGESPFIDEKGKTFPRYRMFSAAVDHDGDRYGFVRNLKSPQDEINHRRSKALHILNSRRLIIEGAFGGDVESIRKEWARPDGTVVLPPGSKAVPDQQNADFSGQLKFLEESKAEIENFGPNPALIGQGLEDSSGRAIALLQQAGIAELGPYLLALKQWKVRVYRDIWNIIQRHWKAERWIRVTDDQDLAQYFQINKLSLDQFGHPSLVNAIGSLDVDIILDEGPDQINMMADNYAVLQSLGPTFGQEFPEIAIELSPLTGSIKKRMLDKITKRQQEPPPPDPKVLAAQQMAQLEQQKAAAGLELDQRKQAADLQAKQTDAMADIELEKIRLASQLEIERIKAQAAIEIDQMKAANAMALERERNDARIEAERERTKVAGRNAGRDAADGNGAADNGE